MSCDLNGDLFKYKRSKSIVSVSSVSSCQSDDSGEEDLSRKIAPEFGQQRIEKDEFARLRSNSEGATALQKLSIKKQEPFDVFPSLPDSVLEKMGLLGHHTPRERLNEEELEQKFIALALAFTIDAATIKDRCERQRRYRDQTETNLAVEIEKLTQKANRIQPLCKDAETSELLSTLLAHFDVVASAACHATIASERYGAVQHEERISDTVSLMISHVNMLKQQRDSARRQLQYTKRVLQNTSSSTVSPRISTNITNARLISKRRASIATISQPFDSTTNRTLDLRKITRRTSDLSVRASSLARNSRIGRLELGLDLVKIKEGLVENGPVEETPSENESTHEDTPEIRQNLQGDTQFLGKMQQFWRNIEVRYNEWSDNGTIHEICCFCAIICFSISIITMANILLEVEFAKRGLNPSKLFWYWTSNTNTDTYPVKKTYQYITT